MRTLVRNAVVIAGIIHSSAAPVRAQAKPNRPDVTGVWRMDTTKFAKRDAELDALTLNVTYTGDTLTIVTNVSDVGRAPSSFTSRYVPERLVVASRDTNTRRPDYFRWSGDTLVLHSVHVLPARTLVMEERWNIDPSGVTLSRYQHVVDGKRVSQQTLVFTRQ